MIAANVLHGLVGLLPVLGFLAALLYLDGYKLVRLRVVIAILAAGIVVAYACYLANAWLGARLDLDFTRYSRYVAPVVEELGKALVLVALIRMHRIGFLIDASILVRWLASGRTTLDAVRPALQASTLMIVGAQVLFASFFLSMLTVETRATAAPPAITAS